MCIFISVSLFFVPFFLSPSSIYKIKHDIKYRSDCSQIYLKKCNIIPTNTINIPNTITRKHRRMCICIGWLLVWLVFVCNVCVDLNMVGMWCLWARKKCLSVVTNVRHSCGKCMHIMGTHTSREQSMKQHSKFFCDVINVRLVCV